MQQHSKSPQSMHRVLPPVASAGLTMLSNVEDAALPGPLRLTRAETEEPHAILSLCVSFFYFFFLAYFPASVCPFFSLPPF